MKRTLSSLLLSVGILLGNTQYAAAQTDPVVEQIIEAGQADNRTMEYLDVLSNRIGGRLIGSNAYDNAVDWCAYMFGQWGLEVWKQFFPFADNGTYIFQWYKVCFVNFYPRKSVHGLTEHIPIQYDSFVTELAAVHIFAESLGIQMSVIEIDHIKFPFESG